MSYRQNHDHDTLISQELLALQQKALAQQNEMDRVRSDNVKLFEKIKFLQNYPGAKGAPPSSLDDMEARYSAQYEQKLDPFTHFNKKVWCCDRYSIVWL